MVDTGHIQISLDPTQCPQSYFSKNLLPWATRGMQRNNPTAPLRETTEFHAYVRGKGHLSTGPWSPPQLAPNVGV